MCVSLWSRFAQALGIAKMGERQAIANALSRAEREAAASLSPASDPHTAPLPPPWWTSAAATFGDALPPARPAAAEIERDGVTALLGASSDHTRERRRSAARATTC